MELPPHFHRLPEPADDHGGFAALIARTPDGGEIQYDLDLPKWHFLNYACYRLGYLAHGSGNQEIEVFEPRKAQDVAEFGDRKAVYAASDGVWAMYFAVVNRDVSRLLMNACVRMVNDAVRNEPHYFFSVDIETPGVSSWRPGTVYLLPRDGFEQQPLMNLKGKQFEIAQWACPHAVRPVAKLTVEPQDFPFLDKVFRHDPDVVLARAKENPDGFPWLDAE